MANTGLVAYDPTNTTEAGFLSALALGETGNAGSSAANEGVGGIDLQGAPRDAYGFPQWSGFGSSHAAGEYQFQPGTWDPLASTYGLNFSNPQDQSAGAWYEAQQVYQQKTGGSLMDALSSGNYASVQQALAGTWPSVSGNAATNGQSLAYDLANGIGAGNTQAGPSAGTPTDAKTGSTAGGPTIGSMLSGTASSIDNFFVRGGLIVVGAIVLVVALWQLLSQHTNVPSPAATAHAIGRTAASVGGEVIA